MIIIRVEYKDQIENIKNEIQIVTTKDLKKDKRICSHI